MTEQTFAMIKSGAIARGDCSHIISAIVDLKGVQLEIAIRTKLTAEQIETFYAEHVEKPYWPDLRDSIFGDVVLMVLSGEDVVARFRQSLGATDPRQAAYGTLRQLFGSYTGPVADNAVHGSDSVERAKWEMDLLLAPALRELAA